MLARTATAVSETTAPAHSLVDAAYAAYDSPAIARALMDVQAATGDWVARQRLTSAS